MIRIRAPGRICLFGEHQDYLMYPTISMAISRYIYLKAERNNQNAFSIQLPDINMKLNIPLTTNLLEYESNRDYLRSGYNQFIRKGVKFNKGYNITITGDIPINAGAASSSALVIAWLFFLNHISNSLFTQFELALMGYNTEVREFGEEREKMDFFSSIYGNIVYLQSKEPNPRYKTYHKKLPGFILGDSLQKKNTVKDLKKVKKTAIKAFNILKRIMPSFNIYETKLIEVHDYLESIEERYRNKIVGNLVNRDLTQQAKHLFDNHDYIQKTSEQANKATCINQFYKKLGKLINEHQNQLKYNIEITTDKIDTMIAKCLDAGAVGAKINGSGFGGTIFAFGLDKQEGIMEAIKSSGGIPYKITTSLGVEQY